MIRVYSGGLMFEEVPYITCIKIRKKKGRHPKWINNGGLCRGCSYEYTPDGTEIMTYSLRWVAN